jgi:signal transduction histidine kinase
MVKSLAARLFLILLVATVGIQALSFGGVLAFVGRDGRRSMNDFLAADLAFIQYSLRTQTPPQRKAMLDHLNRRGHYALSLQSPSDAYPRLGSETLIESAAIVQRKLPAGDQVLPIQWRTPQGEWPALELPIDAGQKLVVSFPSRKPPFAPPSWWAIGAYLLAVSLAVMAAAWWAVRLATRPITRLAAAAQSLGQNLDAPPLVEAGPTEVRRAAGAFNAMQRAIQAHLRERTQILASISHDLKTPLTRLRLRVGALPEGDSRGRVEQDIDAMDLLIQEGLDYAHSSQLRESLVPVDVDMLLETLVEHYADMGQDVRLQGRLGAPLNCAPRALERALQNLVDNAVKYGGCARIELSAADGRRAQIRIEDDGPGIPVELLEKVFEPFFRAEASRNRGTGGTGLGLAIAQNLLRAQGADITLANRAPQGLVATVSF